MGEKAGSVRNRRLYFNDRNFTDDLFLTTWRARCDLKNHHENAQSTQKGVERILGDLLLAAWRAWSDSSIGSSRF
jgi:hypothetical protein